MHVDAIEKGAANPRHVAFDLLIGTAALTFRIAAITARTRVERGDQDKIRGESLRLIRASNASEVILKGLSERFKGFAIKLG